MKVKELIKELKKFDKEMDVYVSDEREGNDSDLISVEMGKTQTDSCNSKIKSRDVVMIRW